MWHVMPSMTFVDHRRRIAAASPQSKDIDEYYNRVKFRFRSITGDFRWNIYALSALDDRWTFRKRVRWFNLFINICRIWFYSILIVCKRMFFFIFAYSFLNLGKLKWFEPGKNSENTKLYFPKGHPNAPFPHIHFDQSIISRSLGCHQKYPYTIVIYHLYIKEVMIDIANNNRAAYTKKRIVYRNRLTPDASNDVAHKIVLIICRGQMQSIRDYGKKKQIIIRSDYVEFLPVILIVFIYYMHTVIYIYSRYKIAFDTYLLNREQEPLRGNPKSCFAKLLSCCWIPTITPYIYTFMIIIKNVYYLRIS